MGMYIIFHASNIHHHQAYASLFESLRKPKSKSKKVYCLSYKLSKRYTKKWKDTRAVSGKTRLSYPIKLAS